MLTDQVKGKKLNSKASRGQSILLDSLIARIGKNETSAMEEFYTLTKSSVYGFALSIVKSHELSEDIMQDTYIRVFQYALNYRYQSKPLAWLLTIVKTFPIINSVINLKTP